MRPRGLHAVSGCACWLLCLQELTDPQTGLPKQEKPAKINESSSTTKNKKNDITTTKRKGLLFTVSRRHLMKLPSWQDKRTLLSI
jgi:hypothetical protein